MKIIIPIDPKPQSRPRFTKQGIAYEEKSMKEYKQNLAYAVMAKFKEEPYQKSLSVKCHFYIEPPKYLLKKKILREALENERLAVDKKPDIDNYLKGVLDALNGIVWADDNIISELSGRKIYSLRPRIEIEVDHFIFKE